MFQNFVQFSYFNKANEMYEKPLWYRTVYLYASGTCQRCKFYFAWVLADLAGNASGLGFNGFDENGRSKWNLVSGVNILAIEVSCKST